jgi:carbonyl reductase 1
MVIFNSFNPPIACCPGYVATDMSSFNGTKTPKEGAITPAWLASSDEVSKENGMFFSDQKYKEY